MRLKEDIDYEAQRSDKVGVSPSKSSTEIWHRVIAMVCEHDEQAKYCKLQMIDRCCDC
jgi:hypothetical protein